MHNLTALICQTWGEIQVKSGNCRAKCPILKGAHQTARSPNDIDIGLKLSGSIPIRQGYPPVQLQVLIICGPITAGLQIGKFLKLFNIFHLHRSPVSRATTRVRGYIFPVPTLLIRTFTPCKQEGMGMHNLTALICQTWGEIQVKSGNCRAKCPILKGAHQTARSPKDIDIGLKLSGSIPIRQGYRPVQLQVLIICGPITAGLQSGKFLKLFNIFHLHRSPVSRAPLGLGAIYFLCLPYLSVPTHPVNLKAWSCIVEAHQSVKPGGKYR